MMSSRATLAERIGYREIRPHCVAERERRIVAGLLPLACQELDIPVPHVRWFRPNRGPQRAGGRGRMFWADAQAHGCASPLMLDRIWLRADLDAAQLGYTVVHECCHLAQFRDGLQLTWSRAAVEDAAHTHVFVVLERVLTSQRA